MDLPPSKKLILRHSINIGQTRWLVIISSITNKTLTGDKCWRSMEGRGLWRMLRKMDLETEGDRLKFIFLDISGSSYSYFPRPQRILARFPWVIFLLKMQKSCKTSIRITKQSLENPATSNRGFSNRETEALTHLRIQAWEGLRKDAE